MLRKRYQLRKTVSPMQGWGDGIYRRRKILKTTAMMYKSQLIIFQELIESGKSEDVAEMKRYSPKAERAYLLNCLKTWPPIYAEEMHCPLTKKSAEASMGALRRLLKCCKKLARQKKLTQYNTNWMWGYSYLPALWRAHCALKSGRPDYACDAFCDVIYYGIDTQTSGVDAHVLFHIIRIIKEAYHDGLEEKVREALTAGGNSGS